jgi:hypothetical protein
VKSLDPGIFEALAPPSAAAVLLPLDCEESPDDDERSDEPSTEAEAAPEEAPEEAVEQAARLCRASQAEDAVAPRKVNRWGGMKGARTWTSVL